MSEMIQINFEQPIALFPLPHSVLLPHTTIPLHIYEARYKKMIADILDSHGMIAMATFKDENWSENYDRNPDLRPYTCVGQIVRHQTLEDGRYNILLQGLCRAKIVDEIDHTPYRMAMLKPTEPDVTVNLDLDESRQQIEQLLDDDLLKQLAAISDIRTWLDDQIPTTALIDLAIMAMCSDFEERYQMLEESDAELRAGFLVDSLCQTRQTLAIADRFEPPDLTDHMFMN